MASSACVSKKKFTKLLTDKDLQNLALEEAMQRLEECENDKRRLSQDITKRTLEVDKRNNDIATQQQQIRLLEEQLDVIKNTNTNLLDRLSDLSIVSKAGAESIQKSIESINQQSQYIESLTSKIQAKDSTNLVLVMNLKRSLSNINDDDVQIEVRGSVVHISISDRMLFRTGSHFLTARSNEVLGKVAAIINDHSELEVMVEGHTDNVPITNSCTIDNWDLSVKRATEVVRVLQKNHGVSPSRMTAAGRSEFVPKIANDTEYGRSLNRRTEIVLAPKLDEYFKLLEPK